MVIFSSTAAVIQLIKLAVFFFTLGLPSAHGIGTELRVPATVPVISIHASERPHSNPRRNCR
ncbi:MAG: hypothetical protein ACK5KM_04905 [Hyphomicrobiaceae bacterium]